MISDGSQHEVQGAQYDPDFVYKVRELERRDTSQSLLIQADDAGFFRRALLGRRLRRLDEGNLLGRHIVTDGTELSAFLDGVENLGIFEDKMRDFVEKNNRSEPVSLEKDYGSNGNQEAYDPRDLRNLEDKIQEEILNWAVTVPADKQKRAFSRGASIKTEDEKTIDYSGTPFLERTRIGSPSFGRDLAAVANSVLAKLFGQILDDKIAMGFLVEAAQSKFNLNSQEELEESNRGDGISFTIKELLKIVNDAEDLKGQTPLHMVAFISSSGSATERSKPSVNLKLQVSPMAAETDRHAEGLQEVHPGVYTTSNTALPTGLGNVEFTEGNPPTVLGVGITFDGINQVSPGTTVGDGAYFRNTNAERESLVGPKVYLDDVKLGLNSEIRSYLSRRQEYTKPILVRNTNLGSGSTIDIHDASESDDGSPVLVVDRGRLGSESEIVILNDAPTIQPDLGEGSTLKVEGIDSSRSFYGTFMPIEWSLVPENQQDSMDQETFEQMARSLYKVQVSARDKEKVKLTFQVNADVELKPVDHIDKELTLARSRTKAAAGNLFYWKITENRTTPRTDGLGGSDITEETSSFIDYVLKQHEQEGGTIYSDNQQQNIWCRIMRFGMSNGFDPRELKGICDFWTSAGDTNITIGNEQITVEFGDSDNKQRVTINR